MKRMLLSLVVVLASALSVSAQSVSFHMGVQGGLTMNKIPMSITDVKESLASKPGWHAGLNMELKLPAYFAIQPAVNFEQSRSTAQGDDIMLRYINVPVALQWGPDLGILRFYAQVVPYVDIMMGKISWGKGVTAQNIISNLKPATFGVGVGGGVEIWRLQISARYNWNLGSFTKFEGIKADKRGVTLSLAYMFL